MEPQLYLIAHKVRGAPAFDIAHRLMIGDEEGWIIPTSGHRAYPTASWLLEDLADCSDYPHERPAEVIDRLDFGSAPDHYPVLAAPKGQGQHSASDLVAALGIRKAPTITRRL